MPATPAQPNAYILQIQPLRRVSPQIALAGFPEGRLRAIFWNRRSASFLRRGSYRRDDAIGLDLPRSELPSPPMARPVSGSRQATPSAFCAGPFAGHEFV